MSRNIISGRDFNAKNHSLLVKLMPMDMVTGRGVGSPFQWAPGLNIDPKKFEGDQGLYFCKAEDVKVWANFLRTLYTARRFAVEIPDNALVIVSDCKGWIKADRVILGEELYCSDIQSRGSCFERFSSVIQRAKTELSRKGIPFRINPKVEFLDDDIIDLLRSHGCEGLLFLHGCEFSSNTFDFLMTTLKYQFLVKYGASREWLRMCLDRRIKYGDVGDFRDFAIEIYKDDREACLRMFKLKIRELMKASLFFEKIDPGTYSQYDQLMWCRYSQQEWEKIISVNPGLFIFVDPSLITETMAEAVMKAPKTEFQVMKAFGWTDQTYLKLAFNRLGYGYPV